MKCCPTLWCGCEWPRVLLLIQATSKNIKSHSSMSVHEIHPIPLFGTCVTISGVADGATLIECNYPHKYSVRKSACTHINVHTFKCAREHRCYRGVGIQTVNDSDTQSCWKDSQNQKNKSTITATGRNTQCVCVYIYVCDRASVLTQCVNVFVIQPSQRKLSSILSPSLTLCLLATRHLRPKNKPSEMNRTKK